MFKSLNIEAKILGPLYVGNSARVGANAVVTKNVLSKTTVMGIPAKEVIKSAKSYNKAFTAYGTPTDIDLEKNYNNKKNKKTIKLKKS